nr:aminotransferase class I/II-fold pyridoxal phosphate-dependent enzyme [Tessaracoccus sp.]
MSLFARAHLAPADPILGLTEAFTADKRAEKVNLGVGVYLGDDGTLPLMASVREAQERLTSEHKPRGYLGIDGMPAYREAARALIFGADSEATASGRVATVQTLGGTGALKVGADLLAELSAGPTVLVSNPSWRTTVRCSCGPGSVSRRTATTTRA